MRNHYCYSGKAAIAALILVLCLVGGGIPLNASDPEIIVQSDVKTVTGRVVDENGEPVLGAAVMVAGTTNGILVDDQGNFEIEASEGQTLTVSLIGYHCPRRTNRRSHHPAALRRAWTGQRGVLHPWCHHIQLQRPRPAYPYR